MGKRYEVIKTNLSLWQCLCGRPKERWDVVDTINGGSEVIASFAHSNPEKRARRHAEIINNLEEAPTYRIFQDGNGKYAVLSKAYFSPDLQGQFPDLAYAVDENGVLYEMEGNEKIRFKTFDEALSALKEYEDKASAKMKSIIFVPVK